jgi:hypothetical protein
MSAINRVALVVAALMTALMACSFFVGAMVGNMALPRFMAFFTFIYTPIATYAWIWLIGAVWQRLQGGALVQRAGDVMALARSANDVLIGPNLVIGWVPGELGRRILMLRPGDLGRPEPGHVLLVGSTRCGKGLWASLQMAIWDAGPIVAIDVKGGMDYTARALDPLMIRGYEIRYSHVSAGVGDGFDPVAWVRDPIRIASMFQDLFAVGRGERWDSVFREAGAALATAVAVWAMERGNPFVEALKEALALGPARWIDEAVKGQQTAIWATRAAGLAGVGAKDLTPGVMQRTLLQHGWSDMANRLRGLLDRESMVKGVPLAFEGDRWAWVIAVDQADLEALRSVVQLWMWALLNEIAARRDRQPGPPMLVIVDEAAAVGVPGLPRWYATLAGRQVSIASIWQTVGQIVGTYGPEGMSEIVGNSSLILVAGGNPDVQTVEWASEVLGAHEVWMPSLHEGGSILDWRMSYAKQVRPWIRPDELSRMDPSVWAVRAGGLRGLVWRAGALEFGLQVTEERKRMLEAVASQRYLPRVSLRSLAEGSGSGSGQEEPKSWLEV